MQKKQLDKRHLQAELDELRSQLSEMLVLNDAERSQRIERALSDFGYFTRTYFPHLATTEPSGLHEWIDTQAAQWGPGARELIAAPRGNAKTTKLARVYAAWRLARQNTWFVVQLSDTLEVATQNLESIKIELEENPRLAQDFPHICGVGRTWRTEEIVTASGVKIKAYGSGKRIRGANYLGRRPDLILCDDLENDENVASKTQRDKLERWFCNAVLNLGPPDGSAQVIYIGTVLHYDSLLIRLSKRADFRYTRFQAIIDWPKHMGLWERWERMVAVDQDAARAFYEDNRTIMDMGATVLWPEMQPLYALMVLRASDRRGFACEYQNEPIDEDLQTFPPAIIKYYQELPPLRQCVGAVDLALGKTKGDYAALIILGEGAEDRRVYVAVAEIERYTPRKIIERIIALQRVWGCTRWAVEETAYQEFFKTVLIDESRKQDVAVPAVGVRPKTAKEVRIESLAPHMENGTILFNPAHRLLLDQLREYPLAPYDDGPDALHMAFSQLHGGTQIEYRSSGSGSGLRGKLRSWAGRGF